jgi:hypothetical protein
MTTIKDLSEKLGALYNVPAYTINEYEDRFLENGHYQYETVTHTTWLAEDTAWIGHMADEMSVNISHREDYVAAECNMDCLWMSTKYCMELYANHPNKATAAHTARIKCLIHIKDGV